MSSAATLTSVNQLLSLGRIMRHYEDALAKAQGEHFNLFEILHIGHYEVSTHSPLLAELLNPAGTHGQGSVFLEKFLDQLEIENFESKGATVQTEVSVGIYGRIDIVITDRSGGAQIFVENKIYAALQDRQLERYQEYDSEAKIVYLTLYGEDPRMGQKEEGSAENAEESFPNLIPISYQTHVLSWLDACRKEAATAPTVREAITHYIHLIQRLTQQNPSARMNQKISEAVLANEETLQTFFILRNASQHIEDEIVEWVTDELSKVAAELGFTMELTKSLRSANAGFRFIRPSLTDANLTLNFEFEYANFKTFCAGFAYIDSKRGATYGEAFKLKFDQARLGKTKKNESWPAWFEWSQYGNWTDGKIWAAIRYGQFIPDAKAVLLQLLKMAEEVIDQAKSQELNQSRT